MQTKTIILCIVVLLSLGFVKKNNLQNTKIVEIKQIDTPIKDSSFVKQTNDSTQKLINHDTVYYIIGTASYYHDKFIGRKTSMGHIYSQEKYTAAHRKLPLGTKVKITNLSNGKNVVVLINDRMGKSRHEIDVTTRVAKELNFLKKGWTKVKIEVIKK